MMIKDNIRKFRKERGLTMEELGKRIGVSKQTIQRYESGEIITIPYDKIYALASALNVGPGELMGFDDAGSNKKSSADTSGLLAALEDDKTFEKLAWIYTRLDERSRKLLLTLAKEMDEGH